MSFRAVHIRRAIEGFSRTEVPYAAAQHDSGSNVPSDHVSQTTSTKPASPYLQAGASDRSKHQDIWFQCSDPGGRRAARGRRTWPAAGRAETRLEHRSGNQAEPPLGVAVRSISDRRQPSDRKLL